MSKNLTNIALSAKDVIALFDNLSTMLGAGISILESVDSLLEDAKGSQKLLLTELRNDLSQGKQIYISFQRFPKIFNPVTIHILKASEEAGTLDVTLKDLKNHIQGEMEFIDKVRSAMIYPAIILSVFVLVMLVILVFVMPKLTSVFGRMSVELPIQTQLLMNLSAFIIKNPWQVVLMTIGAILTFVLIWQRKKDLILRVFFALPLISSLVAKIDIARFTRSMGLLLSSGLTITNSLELCQDIVFRKDMRELVAHTRNNILSGRRFSDGFRDGKGLVPMLVIKLTEAGERTGTLDQAMQHITEHMDYEVKRSLATLTSLLEPIMLLFIGLVVGGMMLSIIAPIYSMIGSVGR
jgi:type II secretory pathway component PulF